MKITHIIFPLVVVLATSCRSHKAVQMQSAQTHNTATSTETKADTASVVVKSTEREEYSGWCIEFYPPVAAAPDTASAAPAVQYVKSISGYAKTKGADITTTQESKSQSVATTSEVSSTKSEQQSAKSPASTFSWWRILLVAIAMLAAIYYINTHIKKR